MKTTHTTIEFHNGNQYIEFINIKGELVNIEGPFVDGYPTGDDVLVHTEVDDNDNVIHEVYAAY